MTAGEQLHDTAARRQRLGQAIADEGIDAVLASNLLNVRYLTGFTGSSGALLVTPDGKSWLATDSRYQLQAAEQSPEPDLIIDPAPMRALVQLFVEQSFGRVGFEDQTVSVADHTRMVADAPLDWVPTSELVTGLRMQKDESELELLREACAASSRALESVLPRIAPGITERQVARWLDDSMRGEGTEGPGFDSIVASGPNSAVPHHEPTDRRIEVGDFVKMDFGARVGGYHADMTRTVVVGKAEDWQHNIYSLVAQAQRAGKEALAPGVAGTVVDEAARSVINAAGFGEHFGHGLGHGVGLEIHEAPYLGVTSTDRIAETVPVTVEPGIYLPGRGGVRIEDTVVVHHDRVETLTSFTRDLLVVA